MRSVPPQPPATDNHALQVYLLGQVGFEDALNFQRRLAFQVAGDRSQAGLLICEHPPLITIGREGSRRYSWTAIITALNTTTDDTRAPPCCRA
jgi:lipoate-protein ligase B